MEHEFEYKVVVCGSRGRTTSEDFNLLHDELEKYLDRRAPLVLIHGACTNSADEMADAWAKEFFGFPIEVRAYPAKWVDDLGNRNFQAGFERNTKMLDEEKPDLVIALWNGSSNGTLDTIRKAVQRGIRVVIV